MRTWYIIDSSWLSSWLYFAHYDKYVSPCPGPCRNDDLITYDHSMKRWVPKKNLVLATKDHPGHYCKINKETWSLFVECYDHSGPTITVTSDGVFTCALFSYFCRNQKITMLTPQNGSSINLNVLSPLSPQKT